MYSFEIPVQDLQMFGPKKKTQKRIFLHFIQCAIGREKRKPKTHLRYAAERKEATDTSYRKGISD